MTAPDTTVRFDHREDGTAEQRWQPLLQALGRAAPLRPPGGHDHLIVVAAHPDDETLGAGGLIASVAPACRVSVLVASAGEASLPGSPTHTPQLLARLRCAEVRSAVRALHPRAHLTVLGLPDGRLEQHVAEIATAIDRLDSVQHAGTTRDSTTRDGEPPGDGTRAGRTYLVAPWAGDRHPDHLACARAAATSRAAAGAIRWEYPIWAWHWADPDGDQLPLPRLRALPLATAARDAKRRALRRHRSQHEPLSPRPGDEAILPPQVLAHFDRGSEVFVELTPAPAPVPAPVPAWTGPAATTPAADYFDGLYADSDDPWGLADRFYEQRKRALLMASLPRRRFRRAFEPGCATGLITEQLAARCDQVVAWDTAAAALARASERLREHPNAQLERAAIPTQWPAGDFDLIVLSEVGYYCADLGALAARVQASLSDDGVLIACHWRHPAPHAHSAEQVHAALTAGLPILVRHEEADFLLEVCSRDARSVAAVEEIV